MYFKIAIQFWQLQPSNWLKSGSVVNDEIFPNV